MVEVTYSTIVMVIMAVSTGVGIVLWAIRTLRQFFGDVHEVHLEYRKSKRDGKITPEEADRILDKSETAFENLSRNLKRVLVPGYDPGE